MNEKIMVDMLKNFFNETRIRKYNIKKIIKFLEENVYETFITPNFDIINEYKDFSTDFDNCLNDLSKNAREILIQKYGLIDGVNKTASEIAINNKLSSDGVSTSIRNSIIYLKKSGKIIKLKKYFIIYDSYDKKDIENIMKVINHARKLEMGDKDD